MIYISYIMPNATIVTAYFILSKSKEDHGTYCSWMVNMLAIDNPMVIFCEHNSVSAISELRKSREEKTRIVVTTFNEFYSYRYYADFKNDEYNDSEIHIGHNAYLYMIWSEKSNFLKRAVEMDPFNTDYFLWVDIGCFRRKNTDYIQWPNIHEGVPLNKVLLLQVEPFQSDELEQATTKESLPLYQFNNRIGGTIFGGGKEVLLQWHDKYYDMLEYFIKIRRFIGKDQSIMNSVYLLNREMCKIVDWRKPCHDKWFYLQDYLRTEY